jgi:hypothetical protein
MRLQQLINIPRPDVTNRMVALFSIEELENSLL